MLDIDAHMRKLESVDEVDPASALSELLAAVASFNADIAAGQDAFGIAGIPDRLQEWLDKLLQKLRAIVDKLVDVASFTVSVGTPFNVSIAVTFAKPPA